MADITGGSGKIPGNKSPLIADRKTELFYDEGRGEEKPLLKGIDRSLSPSPVNQGRGKERRKPERRV